MPFGCAQGTYFPRSLSEAEVSGVTESSIVPFGYAQGTYSPAH
ncbi:hypothetical protein Cabys_1295 [Caldithrix abyssi DSM 13497]|uniref:Uncharacterized protein n=1 Tax=Caldithrix abyssi DSM 13497 TaxID=880073 RepID=A0A1J1C6L5_CALAY|nr:hypothetical protein Cabys_1295 [Caldithrix abyssi DSM 13497]